MRLNLPMPNVADDVRCQYKLRQDTEIDHCVQIENPNGPNPGERIWYRPEPISYFVPDSNVTILQFRWLWLWASLNPAALALWPWPGAERRGTSPWRSLVEVLCNHIQILISILQNPFPEGWKMKTNDIMCYQCKTNNQKSYSYFELAKLLSFTFHWKILSSIVSALIPVSEADSIIDTKSLMRMPDAASVLKTWNIKLGWM